MPGLLNENFDPDVTYNKNTDLAEKNNNKQKTAASWSIRRDVRMSGALEWTLGQLPRKGNNWTNLSLKERKKERKRKVWLVSRVWSLSAADWLVCFARDVSQKYQNRTQGLVSLLGYWVNSVFSSPCAGNKSMFYCLCWTNSITG